MWGFRDDPNDFKNPENSPFFRLGFSTVVAEFELIEAQITYWLIGDAMESM